MCVFFQKREQFWIEQQKNDQNEHETGENKEKLEKDDLEEKQCVEAKVDVSVFKAWCLHCIDYSKSDSFWYSEYR